MAVVAVRHIHGYVAGEDARRNALELGHVVPDTVADGVAVRSVAKSNLKGNVHACPRASLVPARADESPREWAEKSRTAPQNAHTGA
jgi:hypothetical protein